MKSTYRKPNRRRRTPNHWPTWPRRWFIRKLPVQSLFECEVLFDTIACRCFLTVEIWKGLDCVSGKMVSVLQLAVEKLWHVPILAVTCWGTCSQLFQDANALEDKYNDVATQLDAKYNETRQAKDRADRLRDRAAKLYQDTYEKIERLRGESDVCSIVPYSHLRQIFSPQKSLMNAFAKFHMMFGISISFDGILRMAGWGWGGGFESLKKTGKAFEICPPPEDFSVHTFSYALCLEVTRLNVWNSTFAVFSDGRRIHQERKSANRPDGSDRRNEPQNDALPRRYQGNRQIPQDLHTITQASQTVFWKFLGPTKKIKLQSVVSLYLSLWLCFSNCVVFYRNACPSATENIATFVWTSVCHVEDILSDKTLIFYEKKPQMMMTYLKY